MLTQEQDLNGLVQAVRDAGVELTGSCSTICWTRLGRALLYALSGLPRSAFEGLPMPRNTCRRLTLPAASNALPSCSVIDLSTGRAILL